MAGSGRHRGHRPRPRYVPGDECARSSTTAWYEPETAKKLLDFADRWSSDDLKLTVAVVMDTMVSILPKDPKDELTHQRLSWEMRNLVSRLRADQIRLGTKRVPGVRFREIHYDPDSGKRWKNNTAFTVENDSKLRRLEEMLNLSFAVVVDTIAALLPTTPTDPPLTHDGITAALFDQVGWNWEVPLLTGT